MTRLVVLMRPSDRNRPLLSRRNPTGAGKIPSLPISPAPARPLGKYGRLSPCAGSKPDPLGSLWAVVQIDRSFLYITRPPTGLAPPLPASYECRRLGYRWEGLLTAPTSATPPLDSYAGRNEHGNWCFRGPQKCDILRFSPGRSSALWGKLAQFACFRGSAMEGEQYDPQIHSRIRACLYRGCFSVDSHYCCAGRNLGVHRALQLLPASKLPRWKEPAGGLVVDKSGNLYGTTNDGGTGNGTTCDSISVGCGTVFKVTPDGVETVLYSFCTKTDCEDAPTLVADLSLTRQGISMV